MKFQKLGLGKGHPSKATRAEPSEKSGPGAPGLAHTGVCRPNECQTSLAASAAAGPAFSARGISEAVESDSYGRSTVVHPSQNYLQNTFASHQICSRNRQLSSGHNRGIDSAVRDAQVLGSYLHFADSFRGAEGKIVSWSYLNQQ